MRLLLTTLVWVVTLHARADLFDNALISPDVAVRVRMTEGGDVASWQFAGIDSRTVFGNRGGDIGTLLVQTYALQINRTGDHPGFFDSDDEAQIELRNVNFNLTRPFGRLLNVRFGHFELPIGLETLHDTNGTLLDYQHEAAFGLKADWGATLNGETARFEYEVGIGRGSTNDLTPEGHPGTVFGRIGTPRDRTLVVGLSAFAGELSDYGDGRRNQRRHRVGVDATFYWRRFTLLGELMQGRTDGAESSDALLELRYDRPWEGWAAWSQLRRSERAATATSEWRLGTRVELPRALSVSLEARLGLDDSAAAALLGQLRYHF